MLTMRAPAPQKTSRPVLRTGYLLTLNSALTSAVGIAYWVLAARLYPAEVVGTNSAAIYAMSFLAGVVQLTLMSVVLRFVPDAPHAARWLIGRALGGAAAVSALGAVGFVLGLRWWAPRLSELLGPVAMSVAFVVATAAWAVFSLQTGALVAVGRSGAVPAVNAAFALGKVALIGIGAVLPVLGGVAVLLSWGLAATVAAGLVSWYLFARAIPAFAATAPVGAAGPGRTTRPTRRDLLSYAGPNLVGSVAWTATATLTPVLMLALTDARRTAVFSLALSTMFALYLVASSFSSGLLAHAPRDRDAIDAQFRSALVRTLTLATLGAAVVAVAAHYVLLPYGSAYADSGATVLRLLALSAVPNAVLAIELGRCRVLLDTRAVAFLQVGLCVALVAMLFVLVPRWGLAGAGTAWLLAESAAAGAAVWWHHQSAHSAVAANGGPA